MSDQQPRADAAAQDETVGDGERDPFDRLAEEFADRCRRGESPSISEYEARCPEAAERIRRLLPTVAIIEQLGRGGPPGRDEPPAGRPPERLGEFRVLRELGRGGMGVVYEAVQESLGRHVALKVVHHVHLDAKRLRRFQREAQAVAQLHHTNIVPIFGVGEHAGLPYYVMQYISGSGLDVHLAAWRSEGPPPGEARWRFVARVGAQAAGALRYAHEQGVLHRDVKPANLLVDEHQTVWVTDFGLAKLTGHDDLTASGDVIGTLRYLAPEGLRGEADNRSDVYSLGLTLYELVTLNLPFGELSPSALLRRVSEGQPTRPRKLDPAIPRDLETIVLKAIAREPGHRYATAGAMADDLKCFLEDRPILARRTTAAERVWRWSRRNRATAALTATAAGSLLLAAVVGWVGYASTARALWRADDNVALSLAVFEELFDKLAPQGDALPPPPGRQGRRRPTAATGPEAAGPPGRRPPPLPPNGPGGDFFGADHRLMGEPAGPPRPRGPAGDPALLQSVLTFYERFARQNETNSRLQSEAARAYFKIGSLNDRLGRVGEADDAYARSAGMLDGLAARFPGVSGYRTRLVEVAIMADPWSADPSSLERLGRRLDRARVLIDRLAADSPGNLDYAQARVHVYAKLGAVSQRRGRAADAEAHYRRAIELGGSLVERSPGNPRARLDRAFSREALARLVVVRGARDEARAVLDATVADLRSVARDGVMLAPVADRFESLGEMFQTLGDDERAKELARLADDLGERARRHQPGPGRRRPPAAEAP